MLTESHHTRAASIAAMNLGGAAVSHRPRPLPPSMKSTDATKATVDALHRSVRCGRLPREQELVNKNPKPCANDTVCSDVAKNRRTTIHRVHEHANLPEQRREEVYRVKATTQPTATSEHAGTLYNTKQNKHNTCEQASREPPNWTPERHAETPVCDRKQPAVTVDSEASGVLGEGG